MSDDEWEARARRALQAALQAYRLIAHSPDPDAQEARDILEVVLLDAIELLELTPEDTP